MDAKQQIDRFKEFLETEYYEDLLSIASKNEDAIIIEFSKLSMFDIDLAEALLEQPEDTIKAAEYALTKFDIGIEEKNVAVRFKNLPASSHLLIRDIRSKELNKFYQFKGLVRQKSDVRPQVTSAKFECPSCGNIIPVLQLDQKFKEPGACSVCGRKGKFNLLSKELVDAQKIVLEEDPEDLDGAEQPKRINIFLKNDLASPISDKRTNPGSKIIVTGIIKEVPITLQTGGKSTRFDLMVEGNYLEPMQEEFQSLKIAPEKKEELLKLSKDPQIYEKLISSIAPTIYGHDRIKEALVLQMFGGRRKTQDDGVQRRGDIHILLIGDPGCILGDSQVATHTKGMQQIISFGKKHLQPVREALTQIRKGPNDKPYAYATTFQHYKKQPVLRVTTETGKEIVCTYNQPLLTKEGWKRADSIPINTEIMVMPKIPNNVTKLAKTNFKKTKTGPQEKKVILPEKVTKELAALYGYILGDGNIYEKRGRITFYVNEEEKDLIKSIEKKVTRCFNTDLKKYQKTKEPKEKFITKNGKTRKVITSQKIYTLELNSKIITNALKFLKDKKVPQEIFASKREIVATFLSWLFEADGCTFGKGRDRLSVQLKSRTPKLLKDTQLLLLFFGIQSRIIEDNLVIRRSRDIKLFASHIGFQSENKKKKLKDVLEYINPKSEQQQRKKPQRYEKVKSIEFAGVTDVYDFEVPRTKTFIANGIVVHNSGKSQLLKRVSHVAPKSRFVSGKGASGAGLCVSPNSNILTSSGAIENIQRFVENNLNNPEEYRPGIFREKNKSKTKILSMSKELNLQTQNPQTIWKLKAPKEMYRIVLRSGKKIEITENTKLFTIRNGKANWTKAINLKESDYIGTPRKTNQGTKTHIDTLSLIESNPVIHETKEDIKQLTKKLTKKYGTLREAAKKIGLSEGSLYYNWTNQNARGNIKLKDYLKLLSETKTRLQKKELKISIYNGKKHKLPLTLSENFLYLAGLIVGDGDIRKSGETYSIRLSGKTKELHEEFRKTLNKEFSLKYDIQKASAERPESTRTHSKILKELLTGLGVPLSPKSHRINLTNKILELKNKPLSSFIAGLYDSDGCITKRNTKGGNSIQYYTTSETLARQLQLILQRYEIHSKIRRREQVQGKIKSRHVKWCVEITGSGNIKRFKKNIPLKHPEKKKVLAGIQTRNENTNIDIIPGMKEKIIKELNKNLKKEDLEYLSLKNEASTKRLKSILKKYEDIISLETKNIIKSAIRWDEIKKIEKFKTKFDWVYDLTVKDSHNFVVDGVLVHNTAAVVRDEFIRGWALEAGALVLANRGMVCIDELDKMSKEDTSAMHEALEQQSISISKANIQATLRSETTVLAAANPKFGRFDPYDILVKQIDLPPTLINRFDLIFPVKDLPDKERDTKLASFILKLHKDQTSDEVALDTDTIKLYIAYAKQNVFPQLTEPALKEIQDYFVNMRNQGNNEDKIQNIPISARQLEGLVRLAEASAKTRLSNKVTKQDARRAIDLLHHCLTLIGLDEETGKFDIDRIATGITASQRGNIHIIKEIIQDLENSLNAKIIPVDDIVREAEIKGIPESKTEEILDGLKRKGDIYNPKPGQVSRM